MVIDTILDFRLHRETPESPKWAFLKML